MSDEAIIDERLDIGFAVFNNHINDAGDRADKEFIAQFGKKLYAKHIKPCHDKGIMVILHKKLETKPYRMAWVAICTAFVNESVRPKPKCKHCGGSGWTDCGHKRCTNEDHRDVCPVCNLDCSIADPKEK